MYRPLTYLLAALGAIVITTGCASNERASLERPLTGQSQPEGDSTEDQLWRAIVEEMTSRGWPLATTSRRFNVVATEHEALSARLRKRRVARIVRLPQGGAISVTVEVERDVGPEGSPEWVAVTEEATRRTAAQEEMEIARAIEKRFHESR